MDIRFWGTRGSIATPGPATVRYGGNTSCVEVRSSAGTRVVLDCGTGARVLGQSLVASGAVSRGHLLIGHTHWDHIQGLPFFAPLFQPGSEWDIYAPRGMGESLRETLAGQMEYTYFPVALEQLSATIRYHELVEGTFTIDDVAVTTRFLNHPALVLGYRLQADGATIVYATDHEPYSRDWRQHLPAFSGQDQRHVDFLANADLVIHDAQYVESEFPAKAGWGHSPVEYVVSAGTAARVRRLVLFHHDPLRSDDAVETILDDARRLAATVAAGLDVVAAAEGQSFTLGRIAAAAPTRSGADEATDADHVSALLDQSVLVAVSNPTAAALLSDAVRADGSRLAVVADGDAALARARADRPALILVERDLPGRDAFALATVLRELRATGEPTPTVVAITPAGQSIDPGLAAAAGIDDSLATPFSTSYARARIRAWRLRTACRWQRAPMPETEAERIEALRRLQLLDTASEERFERITRLATTLFDVPIALISLVDRERQWFKSAQGLSITETSREIAFCAHAILDEHVLVVNDALTDRRFAENPLVTGDPHVRFYAGAPLSVSGGQRVGTLCLIDHRPRELTERDLRTLRELANQVQAEFGPPPASAPPPPRGE